jgi:hypothetical protein
MNLSLILRFPVHLSQRNPRSDGEITRFPVQMLGIGALGYKRPQRNMYK